MIIFCPKWVFLSNLNEGDSVSKKEVNFEYYSVTRTQCMTVPNSSNPFEVSHQLNKSNYELLFRLNQTTDDEYASYGESRSLGS